MLFSRTRQQVRGGAVADQDAESASLGLGVKVAKIVLSADKLIECVAG